ncbi:MAG: hypothetical protein ACK5JS_05565 [Mangrovibacterium sp.]
MGELKPSSEEFEWGFIGRLHCLNSTLSPKALTVLVVPNFCVDIRLTISAQVTLLPKKKIAEQFFKKKKSDKAQKKEKINAKYNTCYFLQQKWTSSQRLNTFSNENGLRHTV